MIENTIIAIQVITKIVSPLFTGEGLFIVTVFGLVMLVLNNTFKQA